MSALPSVLIRKSTGEIIKHALYPREDMQPIIGLDPDLEWLVKHEPYLAPDYDSRIFILNRIESITKTAHPDYEWLNQYQITYSTAKRTDQEITVSIENAEVEANETMIPYNKQLKLLALSVGVLFRNLDGMTLTPKEQTIKTKMLDVAVRIWKNDAAVRAKVNELTAGTEPNIDEGWEKDK